MSERQKTRLWANWALILTIVLNAIALIGFFVKMDSRLAELEKRREEVNPQRVTQKDILLLEEKIKNINSNVSDIKADLREINQKLK